MIPREFLGPDTITRIVLRKMEKQSVN